jgi:hypothetical protein
MNGEDVERWQLFLVGQNQPLEADGKFGDGTFNATKAFQAQNGLDDDGIVGPSALGRAMVLGFNPLEDPGAGPTSAASFPPVPAFKGIGSTAERQRMFGKFSFVSAPLPKNKENIRITDNFAKDNIVLVKIPQLIGVRGAPAGGGVELHKSIVNQVLALWQAWEDAHLIDHILTWDGSFVPRFQRGSRDVLSNHSFGTAFDINAESNKMGIRPPIVGKAGSIRELVPLANDHGFYWGGHFSKRPDGMHFEVAVIKP